MRAAKIRAFFKSATPILLAAVLPLFLSAAFSASSQKVSVADRLERLAATTTHFATDDILYNRRTERRWPAALLREQDDLARELRALGGERDALAALLDHDDPKVRTLALGALFMREDPHDLPLIAALRNDGDPTLTLLHESMNSAGGALPLAEFEGSQTVGAVAKAMIAYWLRAAPPASSFEEYWAERGTRTHTASWFAVKLARATGWSYPIRGQALTEVRRVLAEIDALPTVDRAWTLLYVRELHLEEQNLLPVATIVAALKSVGPDALMKLLRREPPNDDPDFRSARNGGMREEATGMMLFVLAHARDLLRPGDADALLAQAETMISDKTVWRAAAAELRAMDNADAAAQALKQEIAKIPLRGFEGQGEQAALAAALWRMRGGKETAFLVGWFYAALPLAGLTHGPGAFLSAVEKEARPDTPQLLAAIVADARFNRTDWPSLERLLMMVNPTVATPLVATDVIYDYQPRSDRRDRRETLARWRNLLRRHFSVALAPPAPPSATPRAVVSTPAWTLAIGEPVGAPALTIAVSPDGRFLATGPETNYTVALRNAANGEKLSTITDNGSGLLIVAFPPGVSQPQILGTARDGIQSLQMKGADGRDRIWTVAKGPTANFRGAVDRGVTLYASNAIQGSPDNTPGVFDLRTGRVLWRLDERIGDQAALAMSADGRVMAIGGGNWPHRVRAYDASTGRVLFESVDFSASVSSLAWTPDGTRLVAAAPGDEVRIWNVATGQVERRLAYTVGGFGSRGALAVSSDARRLAVNDADTIGVFDLATGDLRWELRMPSRPDISPDIAAMAFSPDGKTLYTADFRLRLSAWRLE